MAYHFITGMGNAITGKFSDSATTQLLLKTGMPYNAANITDASLSMAGSFYGLNAIRQAQWGAIPAFRLPEFASPKPSAFTGKTLWAILSQIIDY